MGNIRQRIKVDANATLIMKLPCVFSCHKEADGKLCYLLYDWDEQGRYKQAYEGDWLYEDYDGNWSVVLDNVEF